jgi:L-serine dehydratase
MKSIKDIYRIGHGPSSSHTLGPRKAAVTFLKRFPGAASYRVTLFGSLAATGRGHLTDTTLIDAFEGHHLDIVWKPEEFLPFHSNALRFEALDGEASVTGVWTAYSIGGGSVVDETTKGEEICVYPHTSMDEILEVCHKSGIPLWQYVENHEGVEIWEFLMEVWKTMEDSISRGLKNDGVLPGELNLHRKAFNYMTRSKQYKSAFRKRAMLFAYALAVSEENAAGGLIVTAPTCGSSGVVPAVMKYLKVNYRFDDRQILRALATAGLIGMVIKHNASVSGAEVGCQGEIGTACAMASGGATQLFGGSVYHVEYSAEMGLEHHLGLTCDPVCGLVQIPCIERNAMAASRALAHNTYATLSDGSHRISLDDVIKVMMQTGRDLQNSYKETSTGGLAII